MRVIFMGTAAFAVPSLFSLNKSQSHEIVLVVTQPDAPSGRGQKISSPPVKNAALSLSLPVEQPEKLLGKEFLKKLASINADVIFCAAYGKFLPSRILNLCSYGAINLHPSALPQYRGAAPVQRTLMDGKDETAITFFSMVKEMDAGDILYQKGVKIDPGETAGELLERTAEIGASKLPELLSDLKGGKIEPEPQDHSKATFAPVINKKEGKIDWNQTAVKIFNLWRGLTPEPGIFTFLNNRRVKIVKAALSDMKASNKSPAGAIWVDRNRMFVFCGNMTLVEILQIQPEGKSVLSIMDFINGYKPGGKFFS